MMVREYFGKTFEEIFKLQSTVRGHVYCLKVNFKLIVLINSLIMHLDTVTASEKILFGGGVGGTRKKLSC